MAVQGPFVTDPMWWLWRKMQELEPESEFGGIYANKAGYHNIPRNLPPDDYSLKYGRGPEDKAAAIDWTLRTVERMKLYSDRLLASGRDMDDERGNVLVAFYGNIGDDQLVDGWDFQLLRFVRSDTSHLWHIHLEFLRTMVDSWPAVRMAFSILSGQSVQDWRADEARISAGESPATQPAPVPVPAPVAPASPQPGSTAGPQPAWPAGFDQFHRLGLITDPSERVHGGHPQFDGDDVRACIAWVQRRLQDYRWAETGDPAWADGVFEQPTADAVAAWQARDMAAVTSHPGEVWADDYARLGSGPLTLNV